MYNVRKNDAFTKLNNLNTEAPSVENETIF